MGIGNILKRLQDIMRNDEGVNGDGTTIRTNCMDIVFKSI